MSKINIVMADDHHVVRKAIADFLAKEPETLVQAIRLVAAGEEWLSPRVTNILLQSIRNNHRQGRGCRSGH